MKKCLIYLFVLFLINSCITNEPKIIYEQDKSDKVVTNKIDDSDNKHNKKLFADLPFLFDSLEYLYFPIGESNENNKLIRSFSHSYSRSSKSYSIGFMRGRNINCNLNNLIIRPKNNSEFKLLTRSEIKIKSLNYLYGIDTIHGVDRFIYRVIDSDSNKDNIINDDDLAVLYTSHTNGDDFKRISPQKQQLIDWEIIDILGLLYFRTIEDIDRNGIFDNMDRILLYEYDLVKEDSIKLIFNDKIYQEMK